jgi:hypothetical protein
VAGAQEALLAQLERVEGCDEWAVHVYAHRPAIAQCVASAHLTIHQFQHDLAAASPGRAYYLQRQLDEERTTATEQALRELAQAEYEHLARGAAAPWPKATRGRSPRGGAGRVTQPARSTPTVHGEIEILRAAFLVRRASVDTFRAELRSCVESRDGVRCDYGGPWPPYGFAMPIEEEDAS